VEGMLSGTKVFSTVDDLLVDKQDLIKEFMDFWPGVIGCDSAFKDALMEQIASLYTLPTEYELYE